MDKEREIKELAKTIYESGVALNGTDFAFGVSGDDHFTKLAKKVIEAGYGDIKQAVRKFAVAFKDYVRPRYYGQTQFKMLKAIDDLLAEVTGE